MENVFVLFSVEYIISFSLFITRICVTTNIFFCYP